MKWIALELLFIAIVTAATCALPGLFLMLRGMALMSDAISHAMLLGIVLVFLIVRSLHSPILLFGAAAAGLATVWCTELLIGSNKVKKDTAIGLVFPAFFSLGVILITLYARDVHLDADMVLLGELGLVPFSRLMMGGYDCGPYALWQMGLLFVLNSAFIALLRKELTLVTFDPSYASIAGFSPSIIYLLLMSITSITAVAAFDLVGAIVVVALMITPAATAYLITKRLDHMIYYTLLISILSATTGCLCATIGDLSIAGSIATVAGTLFMLAFAFFR